MSMHFQETDRISDVRNSGYRSAPGAPGEPCTWTTGAKDGIGTAYYDPTMGESKSNVWYTLSQGVLTEVYYPDVTQANLQTLQFIVTDGLSFLDLESTDTMHETVLEDQNALIYRQVNTAKNGRYQIEKVYITDPNQHTVLIQVSFRAIVGTVDDYKMFVYVNPVIGNRANDNVATVVQKPSQTYLLCHNSQTAMAVSASIPLCRACAGFVGVSDGLAQLKDSLELRHLYQSAEHGNVSLAAELDLSHNTEKHRTAFALGLGFGSCLDSAMCAVESSLCQSYLDIRAAYQKGWATYLESLHQPTVGSTAQYNVAAMVLRAHEDKLHPGAIIASLTIPWGNVVLANDGGVGGYHLVWSRDLYQIATALCAIGDTATAKRALQFLNQIQQKADGSFPQNSWLDGTPYWTGIQLDQAALPILLAYQLGEFSCYTSLVKPAADFILQNGPMTAQERWEENYGFSPSTIASAIAALVVAARMAQQEGDDVSAALYLWTADKWRAEIDTWTVSTRGALSPDPYYIRISDTTYPDDGHWIEIKNGGGWHPKTEIVDAGFLELVRLGIKAADDPVIVHSLDVIDKTIQHIGSRGGNWYRYNHDGYGEGPDGSPYCGTGQGRPWPLLAGERGEYEIALAVSAKAHMPQEIFTPVRLLASMAASANAGFMIPEQIWDTDEVLEHHLSPGGGTGAATPLAWAMAQYLRLAECIRQGCIVEMPRLVQERYLTNPPDQMLTLDITEPAFGVAISDSTVDIRGTTSSHGLVILLKDGTQTVTWADENGRFACRTRLMSLGEQEVDVIAYDGDRSVASVHWTFAYAPRVIIEMEDEAGDDFGPGTYVYPTDASFKAGDFDLRKVCILADETNVYFEIQLGNLDNPWGGPSGLSKQLIDIYLDTTCHHHPRQRATFGLCANFRHDAAWDRLVRVTGNWLGDASLYQGDGSTAGAIRIDTHYARNTVVVTVPIAKLGGSPTTGWGVMVLVAGEQFGGTRPILAHADAWHFGGGADDGSCPQILDMLVPDGESQRAILDYRKNQPIELPMIRIS